MRMVCTWLLGAALLLAVPLGAAAATPAAAAPRGALVIIGGGLRNDNDAVWQRIVALAGGRGARIAVFASAAADPAPVAAAIVDYLNQYGADAFQVPLAVRLSDSDYRKAADDPLLADAVRGASGVFFSGGDQARITQALVRADGSRSAVLEAVWEVYRRGGVVAGNSAGAAVMSSTMFSAPKTVFAALRNGVREGEEIAPGLGFIGNDVFVDQHFLVRGRFARMIPAMLAKGYKYGLGIDENTAMVVDARRRVEIVGHKGALLVDLSRATTDAARAGFNIANAEISYLDSGDSYDLASHRFTPGAAKAGGLVRPARDRGAEPVFSPDILGRNALVELMENLVNNRRSEAIGIATSGRNTALPELGFQFTLSKTRDSVAYASAAPLSYSILRMRLDIQPLDIGQSLGRQ